MDVNITAVDVQHFSIDTLSYDGALAFLYVFFMTWIVFVASIVSLAVNYYRWQNPQAIPRCSYVTSG